MLSLGRAKLFADGPHYSIAAVDLVRESIVIDMLGLVTLNFRKLSNWQNDPQTFSPADLARLKDSGITVFHPAVGYTSGDIYSESLTDITGWNKFISDHSHDFLRIDCPADLQRAKTSGKIGIVIGQQNSSHFRTVDDVDCFYELGQRVSQLTYDPNRIGGGSSNPSDPGLTEFGRSVIERMNRVGMAIDISHCADRTSLEAIDGSTKPVLVTHSNCRALVPASARCKTDQAIRRMAANGGVMGVTMIRPFIRSGGATTIDDMLSHVDHIARLVGVEHVGIGSDVDLDGRDWRSASKKFDLDGICYETKIFDIAEGLLKRYTKTQAALILGGNFARVLSFIWKDTESPA